MSSGLVAAIAVSGQNALLHLGSASSATDAASLGGSGGPSTVRVAGAAGPAMDALTSGAALTAPATGTVSLDKPTFTVVPGSSRRSAVTRAAQRNASSAITAPAAALPGTVRSAVRGSAVIAIAARYLGVPYLYGGTTPTGFDCSGYVRYVFTQLGVGLPRTADEQLQATIRIPRSQAQPGDLVSFISGGVAYHNGIYAGNGMMYDAPRTGETVSKRAIWSADVVFTRVTR
jgi:cell wall-associated NlpC family hydrolase